MIRNVRRRLELVQNKFGSGARTLGSAPLRCFAVYLLATGLFPRGPRCWWRRSIWWRSSLASSPLVGGWCSTELHNDPGYNKEEPYEKDLAFHIGDSAGHLQRHDQKDRLRHLLGTGGDGGTSFDELDRRHTAAGVPEGYTTGLDSRGPQLPPEIVLWEIEVVV